MTLREVAQFFTNPHVCMFVVIRCSLFHCISSVGGSVDNIEIEVRDRGLNLHF